MRIKQDNACKTLSTLPRKLLMNTKCELLLLLLETGDLDSSHRPAIYSLCDSGWPRTSWMKAGLGKSDTSNPTLISGPAFGTYLISFPRFSLLVANTNPKGWCENYMRKLWEKTWHGNKCWVNLNEDFNMSCRSYSQQYFLLYLGLPYDLFPLILPSFHPSLVYICTHHYPFGTLLAHSALSSLPTLSCGSWKCQCLLSQPPLQLPWRAVNSGQWDSRAVSGNFWERVPFWHTETDLWGEPPFHPPLPSCCGYCHVRKWCLALLQPPCDHKWRHCWLAEVAEHRNGKGLCPWWHPWGADPALELLSSDRLSWGSLESIGWRFCYLWLRASSLAQFCSVLILPIFHLPPRLPSCQPLGWSTGHWGDHHTLREKWDPRPPGQECPDTPSEELFCMLLLLPPSKDWAGRKFLS